MTAPSKKVPRLPFVLLGLMTAFSFGGPLAIGYVLRGGASPNWPPDRAGRVDHLRSRRRDGLRSDDGLPLARPREPPGIEAGSDPVQDRPDGGRAVTLALVGLALLVGSFALCAVLSGIVDASSLRSFGLVDNPGGRKAHRAPTPLGGGVAIWLTMVLMVGLGAFALGPGRAFLPGAVAIHAGGAWERVGQLALILGLATVDHGDGAGRRSRRAGLETAVGRPGWLLPRSSSPTASI